MGKTAKAQHLYRCGRTRFLDRFTPIVHQRFDLAAIIAADERIAGLERAHLHDDGGGRAAAGFDLRFNDGAARCRRRRRFQFHHFGLERHHLEEMIDPGALRRGDFADDRVAAPIFRGKLPLLQLLLDPIDVGGGQIDLVDRDHDLHMRRGFGVADRFQRLRH